MGVLRRGWPVAAGVFALCYLALDSGLTRPAQPKAASIALLGLALPFALGAWAFSSGERGPASPVLIGGLAWGLVAYALVRLLWAG